MKIHFTDHGQDFLTWTVKVFGDGEFGVVTDSEPFQAWCWTGKAISKPRDLKPGDFVSYADPKDDFKVSTIKYPIESIED